jgi:hypothetical protein
VIGWNMAEISAMYWDELLAEVVEARGIEEAQWRALHQR